MSNLNFETIKVEIDEPVATITLNRPAKLNSLSVQLQQDMLDALRALNAGDLVRVIRLKAEGRAFCAGYDLSGDYYSGLKQHNAVGNPEAADRVSRIGESSIAHDREVLRRIADWLGALRRYRKPIVAQVQGMCLSGGLDLIGTCDSVFAETTTRFGHPASRALGIPLTLGVMPIKIGVLRTKQLLFTGDLIEGVEAESWGLINKAVAPEELEETTMRYCRRIAMLPLDMLTLHKESTNRWIDNMGYASSVDDCVDLDAVSHLSPFCGEFYKIAEAQSLKAALDWRDGPFREG